MNHHKIIIYAILLIALSGSALLNGGDLPSPDRKNSAASAISSPVTFIGTHNRERIGYCISGLGDVNGDGFDDFGIGAFHRELKPNDEMARDAGAVYVVLGRENGWIGEEDLTNHAPTFIGKYAYDQLGYAIGNNGDANGDGLSDLLIGAVQAPDISEWHPLYPNLRGRIYLIFGRQSASWGRSFIPEDSADVIYEGETTYSFTGRAVDYVGDMNQDGCDEFIIAANSIGKVYLIKGRKGGWPKRAGLSTASAQAIFTGLDNPSYEPGYAVKGVGDVNGDKIPDFAVGVQSVQAGRVYLIFGRKAMDWGKSYNLNYADVVFTQEGEWHNAGRKVASAGDVNGDGFRDFLIGAPTYPSGYLYDGIIKRGKTYLILGKPTASWPASASLSGSNASWIGMDNFDVLGRSIAGGLDFDGDAFSDFVQASPQSDDAQFSGGPGKIFFMHGTNTGLSNNQLLYGYLKMTWGEQTDNQLGTGLDNVGDANGDGTPDYAVSAPWHSRMDEYWRGKIYLMLMPKQSWVVRGTASYRTGKTIFRAGVLVNGDSLGCSKRTGTYAVPVRKNTSPAVSMGRTHAAGLGDTTVSFYDAAQVARHVTRLALLSGDPLKSADVNGDGAVTIADAAEIARFAVGIHGGGAVRAGDWFFEPSSRTYASISSDQEGQNYTGYIRGDVDGSWGSGLSKASRLLSGLLDQELFRSRDTMRVEFRLRRPVPMWSFDLGLEYEQRNLSYIGYETGDACPGFTIFDNAQDGVLRIGGYRADGPEVQGRLVILKFRNQYGTGTDTLRLRRIQIDQAVIDRNVELNIAGQSLPSGYALLRSFPNPFNNRTVVEYAVKREGPVRLGVYDVLGSLVRILENGKQSAGPHRAAWDGTDGEGRAMPSGMYVARMEQGGEFQSIKLVMIR